MNVSSAFLDERTRHFTGRQWCSTRSARGSPTNAGARVFLLTGGPGTGKTAIAARIAQMDAGAIRPCRAAAHPARA
jgi:SpoVK/Ycf46/Vps4 family AAA+-type ATPase